MTIMAAELICAVVIVLAAIFYYHSRIFRYYTKFAIFYTIITISATILIPLMLFKPRDYRNASLPFWGVRQVSKILGLKWEIRGHENIVQDVGTVVVANHQSFLDLLVLAEIWTVLDRCTIIVKQEIFYAWPFGLVCWLCGVVFINRKNSKDAHNAINKAAQTINTKKAKIIIAPEGTRHEGDTLLPFKKGAFHIAIASQAPIQPVVISRFKFLDHKAYKFDRGNLVISILPVIETAGLTIKDLESVIRRAYEAMTKEYNILNQSQN
ncbi:hypothetical protein O3M35_000204 [Rhynocoris fuscipes]|uniref:1-acyl-sn-glycerol-3-phosphate acyltransferase n=1 Tax=Rhynocoris fuscipes TaxID=488301 RepID=A0AAW1DR96_9HEMI